MLRIALLVISSKIVSGEESDQGRDALERMVSELPGTIAAYEIVPDDRKTIRDCLVRFCEEGIADVILTIGGTGVRPTDWAPEATRDVIEKEIPGIGEAMRQESAISPAACFAVEGMSCISPTAVAGETMAGSNALSWRITA